LKDDQLANSDILLPYLENIYEKHGKPLAEGNPPRFYEVTEASDDDPAGVVYLGAGVEKKVTVYFGSDVVDINIEAPYMLRSGATLTMERNNKRTKIVMQDISSSFDDIESFQRPVVEPFLQLPGLAGDFTTPDRPSAHRVGSPSPSPTGSETSAAAANLHGLSAVLKDRFLAKVGKK